METVTNGTRRTDGADIFLFSAGATPEQIASADTALAANRSFLKPRRCEWPTSAIASPPSSACSKG